VKLVSLKGSLSDVRSIIERMCMCNEITVHGCAHHRMNVLAIPQFCSATANLSLVSQVHDILLADLSSAHGRLPGASSTRLD
jgi:hypothetical protein